MDAINSIFGILFLAVAILLLERILPPLLSMLLWGILMIGSAIYLAAPRVLPEDSKSWTYLRRSFGLALLIYGGLILVAAANGGRDILRPLQAIGSGAETTPQQQLPFRPIKTLEELQLEVAAAQAEGKPVMLDFYADWCTSCKEMERHTFSDPAVASALQGFVLLQADVTANDESDRELLNHFEIQGPPLIVFYRSDGEELRHLRLVGYVDAAYFPVHIGRVGGQ
jgi:thiol:disulfide interchange protein DsbD